MKVVDLTSPQLDDWILRAIDLHDPIELRKAYFRMYCLQDDHKRENNEFNCPWHKGAQYLRKMFRESAWNAFLHGQMVPVRTSPTLHSP